MSIFGLNFMSYSIIPNDDCVPPFSESLVTTFIGYEVAYSSVRPEETQKADENSEFGEMRPFSSPWLGDVSGIW